MIYLNNVLNAAGEKSSLIEVIIDGNNRLLQQSDIRGILNESAKVYTLTIEQENSFTNGIADVTINGTTNTTITAFKQALAALFPKAASTGGGTGSGGFKKQNVNDAPIITIDQAQDFNFYKIPSLAANRTLEFTNITDKKFGIIVIDNTNGFDFIYKGTTLNLPATGATILSFITDGTIIIFEITATQNINSSVVYDANAQSYFTAIEVNNLTPLTSTEKSKYNKMVVDLKAANVYSKFTHLGTAIGGNASSHSVNAITSANLLTYAPFVNHSYAGMDPDGGGGAANTGFINTNVPANSINPLNFAMFISLTEDTVANFYSVDFGRNSTTNFAFGARGSDNMAYVYHGAGVLGIANTNAIALYTITSKSASDLRVYKNSSLFGSTAADRTLAVFPTESLLMGASSESQNFSNRNINFYALASGFTDAEAIAANNIITTFLTP